MTGRKGAAAKKSDTSLYKQKPKTVKRNAKVLEFKANKNALDKNSSIRGDFLRKELFIKVLFHIGSIIRHGIKKFILILSSLMEVVIKPGLKKITQMWLSIWGAALKPGLKKNKQLWLIIWRAVLIPGLKKITQLWLIIWRAMLKPGLKRITRMCLSIWGAAIKPGVKRFVQVWRSLCDFFEESRKLWIFITAGALIISICAIYEINAKIAYEYMYIGKMLGTVKDKNVVLSTVELVGNKLSDAYGAEIKIDPEKDISFNRIYLNDESIDDSDTVLQRLTYMKDMKVTGYVLLADGNELATFDSRDTAENFLEMVQQEFIGTTGKDLEYIDIGFSEDIKIKEIDTKLTDLQKPESILERVLTGDVVQRYHTVEKGETLSGIAKENGIKTQEIMDMNPEIIPERLQIGQEVKLEMLEPFLNVQTTEIATYIEKVPFEIIYENTSTMYKGEQTVKVQGTKGEREVTAEIIRRNGLESDRIELESITLIEPSSQVVLVGAKDLPPLIGKGYFKYPIRGGKLTSRFGKRGGRMHTGLDLAAPYGTHIYAADGGKVVSAGWRGSLGWAIVIDHGGNRQTLYGHCSKLLVKAGEKVAQGQYIANLGNSGKSTGPHVHFEVHINGVPKNPLDYL
jgi:murein DD-endopeptidase MepM/ murein hydrolase activator NlpD